MTAYVLLNILTELGKIYKMQGSAEHFITFNYSNKLFQQV